MDSDDEPDDIIEDEIDNDPPEDIPVDSPIQTGGNIQLTNNFIEVYKPKITRKIMSVYEFVGTITKLADYLYHLDDLNDIIENEQVNSYINHLELAWVLLKTRKFNATLNRYIENVSFSELDINPRWIEVIEHNFKLHNQSFTEDILKTLELV
jgi:hypothetical protein